MPSAASRGKLAGTLQWVLNGLETVVYGIACLLLVVAAGFVLIGTGAAILDAIDSDQSAIATSVLVLDRILIVTAEFEQPQTEEQLFNLLFELGMLGVLVLSLAAAIFLIRQSAAKKAAVQSASAHPER